MVAPNGAAQLQASGLSFYAARDPNNPYLLPTVPRNAVTLAGTTDWDPTALPFVCFNDVSLCDNSGTGWPASGPLAGTSAEVIRVGWVRFSVLGNDIYTSPVWRQASRRIKLGITTESLSASACSELSGQPRSTWTVIGTSLSTAATTCS